MTLMAGKRRRRRRRRRRQKRLRRKMRRVRGKVGSGIRDSFALIESQAAEADRRPAAANSALWLGLGVLILAGGLVVLSQAKA